MNTITVQAVVHAPLEIVWEYWTKPEHIVEWAFASDDWEAPAAENDVRVGGRFKTVMAAKDGSTRFNFTGTYTAVKGHELMEYDIDGPPSHKASEGQAMRHVKIKFEEMPNPSSGRAVQITQTFDPENENTEEKQRSGWQSILENFKKYVEGTN